MKYYPHYCLYDPSKMGHSKEGPLFWKNGSVCSFNGWLYRTAPNKADVEATLWRKWLFRPIVACNASLAGYSVPVFSRSVRGKTRSSNTEKDHQLTIWLTSRWYYILFRIVLCWNVGMLFRSVVDRGVGRRRQNGERINEFRVVWGASRLPGVPCGLLCYPNLS